MAATSWIPSLPPHIIQDAVVQALKEDLGLTGDITTAATVAPDVTAHGVIASREAGVVSGLDVAAAAFSTVDPAVHFKPVLRDGMDLSAGDVIAEVKGPARAILTGERVALNFLGRMSGIATLTRAFVEQVAGTNADIVDTRKTTPGLRALEKYAVRCGGGYNHRSGLFDAILIKDNHIVAAGGLAKAVAAARRLAGHMIKIEVEVDTLEQLETLLDLEVDAVLLDNMSRCDLQRAVRRIDGRFLTEASGGVTLETVRSIAESGVNLISVGALTHSARVLDLGLEFRASRRH